MQCVSFYRVKRGKKQDIFHNFITSLGISTEYQKLLLQQALNKAEQDPLTALYYWLL